MLQPVRSSADPRTRPCRAESGQTINNPPIRRSRGRVQTSCGPARDDAPAGRQGGGTERVRGHRRPQAAARSGLPLRSSPAARGAPPVRSGRRQSAPPRSRGAWRSLLHSTTTSKIGPRSSLISPSPRPAPAALVHPVPRSLSWSRLGSPVDRPSASGDGGPRPRVSPPAAAPHHPTKVAAHLRAPLVGAPADWLGRTRRSSSVHIDRAHRPPERISGRARPVWPLEELAVALAIDRDRARKQCRSPGDPPQFAPGSHREGT